MRSPATITNCAARAYLVSAALLASALLFTACGRGVSKGDVYRAVSKDLQPGASKSEVRQHLESLEVNGVKATIGDYVPNASRDDVVAPDGKGVIFEGAMEASFSKGDGAGVLGCHGVFVIFYFDESDRLITYHIDCSG